MPDARQLAWRLLTAYDAGEIAYLEDGEALLDGADDRDRSLAREIAGGVLRFGRCYAAMARAFLRPGKQAPELFRLLSIGAHQLYACDRIPPRAAVHSTVELCKRQVPHLRGVVNAVLRRFAERRLDHPQADLPAPWSRIDPAALPDDPEDRWALPSGFIAALDGLPPEGERGLRWCCHQPPLATRFSDSTTIADEPAAAILRQEGQWVWWSDPGQALRGPVASGRCVVQDRGQSNLVAIAAAQAGELVLDCCAAPGGKSQALREAGCRVIAADLTTSKLVRLRENLGVGSLLIQDGREPALAPESFDLVVVDAPCSNSAVFGRRPEAKRRFRGAERRSLQALQGELLTAAATLVRPGGRLIYSTCSLTRDENRSQVEGLDGWAILQQETLWPDAWQQGGYAACLRRVS